MKIIILGTGTFAMDVTDLIDDIPDYEVIGYAVNQPPFEPGKKLLERPIYWIDDLQKFDISFHAVCAIVSTHREKFVNQIINMKIEFASVIHPSARISKNTIIGSGTIINAGVQVATHTTIGNHVIINRGALIGHHNNIHDFVTISPGANLAGKVTIGRRVWVGLGTNILEEISIGECSILGAGALIVKDVPDRVKVVSTPAMVVEKGVNGL